MTRRRIAVGCEAHEEAVVGLLDKLKLTDDSKRKPSEEKSSSSSGGGADKESLPGGASGKEAAEATPQRAAELAD